MHLQLSAPDSLSVFFQIYINSLIDCISYKETTKVQARPFTVGVEEDDIEINDYIRTIKYDARIIASLLRNKNTRREVLIIISFIIFV
jgi:hypothetical protein